GADRARAGPAPRSALQGLGGSLAVPALRGAIPQRSFVNPVRFKQAIDRSAALFSQGAGNSFEKFATDCRTSLFRFLPQDWKRRELITAAHQLFNHDIDDVDQIFAQERGLSNGRRQNRLGRFIKFPDSEVSCRESSN